MIFCFWRTFPQDKSLLKVLDCVCTQSVTISECIHFLHCIIQHHIVKDKDLILAMTTENRWLTVSQQQKLVRLFQPKRSKKTRQPLTKEFHVILNRFYIAQVIIVLSGFAKFLAWFTHQAHTETEVLSSSTRGQTLSNICMWPAVTVHGSYSKITFVLLVWQ